MLLEDFSNGVYIVHHNFKSSLVAEVNSKKHLDPLLIELKESVLRKFNESFSQERGVMLYLATKVDYLCRIFMI